MGGAFYWYFNWSQERIALLQENNAKLTVAVEEQKQAIAAIQKHAEEQAQQMNELQKGLNEANSARRDLEEKFLKFDLEQLARKDSQDLERKMNNATDRAFRQIEGDTGGKPKPLKQKGKDPCAADPKNPACKIPSTKATPVLKDVPLPPKATN
jgi:chromosome segregation ATPase